MRVLLLALYSPQYAAIGETHGVSTVAGELSARFSADVVQLKVVDMVALTGDRVGTALSAIEAFKPDMIGLSLTYGSYDVLRQMYPDIARVLGPNGHIVFGGVLATYIPKVLLQNIEPRAFIVCGEGEIAMCALVQALLSGDDLSGVPNLLRLQDGRPVENLRRLVDLQCLAPPYRLHVSELAETRAQIFVEGSRGCSWAACTFCLRGLTDLEGRSTEFRRFPSARLKADLTTLYNSGIRSVTFADEDFFGGLSGDIAPFVDELGSILEDMPGMMFDASLTIRSVFNHKWSPAQVAETRRQLERLRKIGMRKAFLGIESGAPAQLKRYAKGHSPDEALNACLQVLNSGILLELGFIMFDPLCTLSDIALNIDFLAANDLVGYASFFCNEMRLQVGSRYTALLERHEKATGQCLFDPQLDFNTLTYRTRYANASVEKLVAVSRLWNVEFRRLHYPLKNLSRYGDGGSLRTMRDEVLAFVGRMRREFLKIFKQAIVDCEQSGMVSSESHRRFSNAMKQWALDILRIFREQRGSYVESEIVLDLLKHANAISVQEEMVLAA